MLDPKIQEKVDANTRAFFQGRHRDIVPMTPEENKAIEQAAQEAARQMVKDDPKVFDCMDQHFGVGKYADPPTED